MSNELRSRLDEMTTEELVEVLRVHDLNEWRPEVFPMVESILQGRGVDIAALMAQPPDRDEAAGATDQAREDSPDFVKVLDLTNPAILVVAKSLLEEAGLLFFIKNESAQGLFGAGQMGTGYNLITGPPTLMVEASRSQEARELLEPLLTEAVPKLEDEDI